MTFFKFPYQLKQSEVGYWVDGHCGYLFVGYFDTLEDCIAAFNRKIGGRDDRRRR